MNFKFKLVDYVFRLLSCHIYLGHLFVFNTVHIQYILKKCLEIGGRKWINPTLHLIFTYFLKPEIAENVLKKRYSDFHSIPKQPYGPRMKKNIII
jgi:hypothetical protein